MNIKEKIIESWGKIEPEKQRKIVLVAIVILVVSLGYWGYKSTRSDSPIARDKKEDTYKKISLDTRMTEKTLYEETNAKIGQQNDEIAALRAELSKIIKEQEARTRELDAIREKSSKSKATSDDVDPDLSSMPFPKPPLLQTNLENTNLPPTMDNVNGQMNDFVMAQNNIVAQNNVIGGIGVVSFPESKEIVEAESKKKPSVYLPPSFMKATLLTGAVAPTTSSGASNPVPLLLRIKDLAVLPNSVKANLKGCFVIAEGHGNLGDERVHVRLTTLSCIAQNGTAVIDQPIHGFLQDEDGKVGLKGNVVAPNLASTLARSALAGFFGGVGDAFKQSSTTVSSGAYGTTELWTDTDTNNLIRAGVGGGIATMADDLRKFYLELAAQAVPGIEIGSAKKVEMIVSKGVELTIKDLDNTVGEI